MPAKLLAERLHRIGMRISTMNEGNMPPAAASVPAWQGVHHLALATPSLDATVRFYCGVLGMRLLMTRRAPNGDPHLFIDAGGGATLHFWQSAEAELFRRPLAHRGTVPGALQHLSLRLPDEPSLVATRDRLRAAGVEVTDLIDQGLVRLCFFRDPNGMQLEAACWLDDLTAQPVDYADQTRFADPDPVPAVRELIAAAQPTNR
jgi:catechol 2,3-dioxygenase-like lactoylglutathione lyase family enzyme